MRAFRGHALGDVAEFSLEETAAPQPGPGELGIRVEAVGLGFVDALVMQGLYQIKPELPFVPGGEIVGVVEQLGKGVEGFRVGQRIAAWQFGGGLADQAIVCAGDAVDVPEGLQPSIAAAVLLDYLTAYFGLFDRGGLEPGKTVLVTGASGGVGSAAVQLAAACASVPIALASGADKLAYTRDRGAVLALDYRNSDWRAQLKQAFPKGMDLIFDPVGGRVFEPAFRSLSKGGRHLVIGFAGSKEIPSLPANLVLLKSGELAGVDARYLWQTDKARVRTILSIVLAMASNGRIEPRVAERVPLSQAHQAFVALSSKERIGKVIVLP